MTIEPVSVISPRPKLTRAQRVRIFDVGAGRCYLCGEPIKLGQRWEAEHPVARGLGGSDRLEELRPAHVDCHKAKTSADRAKLAKTTRTRAKHLGIKRSTDTGLQGRSQPEKRAARESSREASGKRHLPPRMLFEKDTGR